VQSQQSPVVTFVVPCYKLAHLLRECVESILAQSYEDFEILIMDDCSPDDTPAVARSFADPRVRYIRNEPNLGHLRNYNRGIELARGRYLWLISADDKLRRPYVLERFVTALESNPGASYVFCPAVKFNDEGETGVYGAHGEQDRVFRRPEFLRVLAHGNSVSAPAAMARKEYYERIGGFPLDLPFAGDWYIWARFALDGDVVYLHEPMINYRVHPLNMTKGFLGPKAAALVRDELQVQWRVRTDAQAIRQAEAVRWVEEGLMADYASRAARLISEQSPYGLTIESIETSIREHTADHKLYGPLRVAALVATGDAYYDLGQIHHSRRAYRQALRINIGLRTSLKYGLSLFGAAGARARAALMAVRGATSGLSSSVKA
jgi:glycosyltransferase involved in cell wall biosynthesis